MFVMICSVRRRASLAPVFVHPKPHLPANDDATPASEYISGEALQRAIRMVSVR
jgi:hypothetical protein